MTDTALVSTSQVAVEPRPPLRPWPAQLAVAEHLRRYEPRAWRHFSSTATREKLANAARLDLLKSAHRIDRASWPEWYAAAEQATAKLGLTAPLLLYQSQSPHGLGASLARIVDESHLVLRGPVATKLPAEEFRALSARELSSAWLWRHGDGELLTAQHVLDALTSIPEPLAAYVAAAKRFARWNRLSGDRGALHVAGDVNVVLSLLARLDAEEQSAATGSPVEPITSAALLLRAEEALHAPPGKPPSELHLRAWAVHRFSQQGDEADVAVARAAGSPLILAELDAVERDRAVGLSRRLVNALLAAEWLQTPAVLAHARSFFADYQPPQRAYEDVALAGELKDADASLRDYCCFLLLDFVTADRELREKALAAAAKVAGEVGLKERFAELAQDELRLRKRQLEKLEA